MLSEDDIVAYAPDPESVRQTVRAAMEDALQSQQTSQTHSMSPAFESAGQANGAAGIEGVAATLRRIASTSEEQLAIDREMRQALDRQAQDMSELNDRIANEILSRSAPHRESEDQNGDSSIDSGSTRPVKSSRELQEEMLEIQRQQLELAKNERAERERVSKESKAKKSSEDATRKEKEQRERQSDSRAIKDTSQILSNLGLSGPASVVSQFGSNYERMQKAANTLRSLGTSLQSNDVPARLALRAAAMGVDPHDLRARESDNATEMAEQHTEAVQYESRLNEEARRRGIDPNELRARESDNARRMREEALNRGTVPMHDADGSLGAAAGDISNRAEEAQRIQEQYAQQQAASDAQPRPTSVSGAQRATSSPSSKAAKTSKNEENAEQNSTLGSKVAGALEDAAGDVISDKISSSVAGKAAASGAGKVGGEAAEAVGTKVAEKAAGEAAEDVAGAAIGKAAASGAGKAIGGGAVAKLAGGALSKLGGFAGGPVGMGLQLAFDAWQAGRKEWWDLVDEGSLQGGGGMTGLQYEGENKLQDLQNFLGISNSNGKDLQQYRSRTSAMGFRVGSESGNNMMDVQKWAKDNGMSPDTAAKLTENMVKFGSSASQATDALQSLKDSAKESGNDLKQYAKVVGSTSDILTQGGTSPTQSVEVSKDLVNQINDSLRGTPGFSDNYQIDESKIKTMISSPLFALEAMNILQENGVQVSPFMAKDPASLAAALADHHLFGKIVQQMESEGSNMMGYSGSTSKYDLAARQRMWSELSGTPQMEAPSEAYDFWQANGESGGSLGSSAEAETESQASTAESSSYSSPKTPPSSAEILQYGIGGQKSQQPFMGQITITTEDGLDAKFQQNSLQRSAYYGQKSNTYVLNSGESQR